jgi:methionine-gamma-lyase
VGGVTCASQEFIDSLKNVNSGASMLLGPTWMFSSASVMKTYAHYISMKQHSHNAMVFLQNALKKDGQNSLSWFKSHPSHELYLE